MDKYSSEQLEYLKKVMRPMLIYFGYAQLEGVSNTKYSYIDLGELTEEEKQDYNGYLKQNDKHAKEEVRLDDDVKKHYKFNNRLSWKKVTERYGGRAYNQYYLLQPYLTND